jgi:high-affinity nickel permease
MADDGQTKPVVPAGADPALQSSHQGRPISVKFFTTRNLSILVIGLVLVVAMIRADANDIPKIVETLAGSRSTAVIGWSIAFVILAAAVIFIKMMSHIYEKEIERLCKERDKLQSTLLKNGEKKL